MKNDVAPGYRLNDLILTWEADDSSSVPAKLYPIGYVQEIAGQKRRIAPPATRDHARRPFPCGVLRTNGGNARPALYPRRRPARF
jgi:hypothetical protein